MERMRASSPALMVTASLDGEGGALVAAGCNCVGVRSYLMGGVGVFNFLTGGAE